MSHCTVANNSPVLDFGGIVNFVTGTLTMTNCTVANNTKGGLFNRGTMTITNSTIVHNFGGGIINGSQFDPHGTIDGTIELQNTLLARNGVDCLGPIISLDHNLIGDPTRCVITLQPSDLTGDPRVGVFTDPGIPGTGHVPLLPDSPAIDAATNAVCPALDQRGQPRPVDGTGDGTALCDIGAVEFFPQVNAFVALAAAPGTAFDPTPTPLAPAGTFTITATFTNISATPIGHPFFEVAELSGGNVLLNADGGPGGVGATLRADVNDDQVLSPGESFTTDFEIGLATAAPFQFFVNVRGVPTP